jgi:hypothetical protein
MTLDTPHTLPHCPWCAFSAERLKPVLAHMESAHPQAWADLACSPLVMGGGVT